MSKRPTSAPDKKPASSDKKPGKPAVDPAEAPTEISPAKPKPKA